MKIESLIRITGGVLQNTPSVSFIQDFQSNITKVTRGCAFFDINCSLQEVQQALIDGAYAILSTQKYEILDKEVAWIELPSFTLALTKLCRFLVQEKNITVIKLPALHFELLAFIRFTCKIKILQQNSEIALMQIAKAQENALFITLESEFTGKLAPDAEDFNVTVNPKEIFSKSLFYTSFIFKNQFIPEMKLNAFFVPYFCSLLEYLDKYKLHYEIIHSAEFEHFIPQFVDANMAKKEFGTSSKVLIFEKDAALLVQELQYLQSIHLQDSFLLCRFNENFEAEAFDTFLLKEPQDILQLRTTNFRYVLILGEKEEFNFLFEERKLHQLTLI